MENGFDPTKSEIMFPRQFMENSTNRKSRKSNVVKEMVHDDG